MENKRLETLKRSSDFESIRTDGKRILPTRFLLVGYKKTDLGYTRVGWTITKKVGSAVLRNKLKRWCREYFRAQRGFFLKSLDINVVFRPINAEFYKSLNYEDFCKGLEKCRRTLT